MRDFIAEIIQQNGLTCDITTLTETEYQQALRQKLIEEAQEAAEANEQNLVTELADLYEAIDAIMIKYGINKGLVIAEQLRRRTERGGFEKRIQLFIMD